MRNEAEVNRALKLYADTVRRICFMYLKKRCGCGRCVSGGIPQIPSASLIL